MDDWFVQVKECGGDSGGVSYFAEKGIVSILTVYVSAHTHFPAVANFTFPYTSGPHRVELFRHSSKIGAGSRSSTLLARRCDDVCCACADDRCSRNATVTKLMKNDVTRLVLLYNETKHAA